MSRARSVNLRSVAPRDEGGRLALERPGQLPPRGNSIGAKQNDQQHDERENDVADAGGAAMVTVPT